jgi:hypothetical protein
MDVAAGLVTVSGTTVCSENLPGYTAKIVVTIWARAKLYGQWYPVRKITRHWFKMGMVFATALAPCATEVGKTKATMQGVVNVEIWTRAGQAYNVFDPSQLLYGTWLDKETGLIVTQSGVIPGPVRTVFCGDAASETPRSLLPPDIPADAPTIGSVPDSDYNVVRIKPNRGDLPRCFPSSNADCGIIPAWARRLVARAYRQQAHK